MTEQIPVWLAVPLIAVLWLSVAYRFYILPGYLKDRADKSAQNSANE